MRTYFLLFLFLASLFIGSLQATSVLTVTGKVTCDGLGVPNVAVTDGVLVVTTSLDGSYKIQSSTDNRFVYYSLPSGYQSPIVGGTPRFYASVKDIKGAQTVNFELEKADCSQTVHSFVVWADPQISVKSEFAKLDKVVEDVRSTIDGLSCQMPVHALALGDLVFDKPRFYKPYKRVVGRMGVPFYQVIGNHDMDFSADSKAMVTDAYEREFGPTHYSFNIGALHYVVLRNVSPKNGSPNYIGYVNESQLRWLEQDLALVNKGSTVVVALHIPTMYGDTEHVEDSVRYVQSAVVNKEALFDILSPFNVHVLAGHSHTQWNTVVSATLFEHVHAAASGAWWQGDICVDGTPIGYTVYMVNGNELSWQYKAVGFSADEQLRIYAPGADKHNADCLIANVYNYDPEWKVEWFFNDVPMGPMEQFWGEDPLARKQYVRGQNTKYKWLGAGSTNHLFKAKIPSVNGKIKVMVTDRFGRVYVNEL